jgi:hypothetical protein
MNKTTILKILVLSLILGLLCGCIESNTTNVSGDIDYAESFMDEGYSILDSVDFKNQSESEEKLRMAKSKFSDANTIFSYIEPVEQSDNDTINSDILICNANLKFIDAHLEYYELFGPLGPYDDYFYYYDYNYFNSKEENYNKTIEILLNVEYSLNLAEYDLKDSEKISTDPDSKKIEKTRNYIQELYQRKENAELMINSPDKYDSIYQKFLNSTDMDESKFLVIQSEFNNVTLDLRGIDYENYPELEIYLKDAMSIGQGYNETMNEYMDNYEILLKSTEEINAANAFFEKSSSNLEQGNYDQAITNLYSARTHFKNAKGYCYTLKSDYGSAFYDAGYSGYYASDYYISATDEFINAVKYMQAGDEFMMDISLSSAEFYIGLAENYI